MRSRARTGRPGRFQKHSLRCAVWNVQRSGSDPEDSWRSRWSTVRSGLPPDLQLRPPSWAADRRGTQIAKSARPDLHQCGKLPDHPVLPTYRRTPGLHETHQRRSGWAAPHRGRTPGPDDLVPKSVTGLPGRSLVRRSFASAQASMRRVRNLAGYL